jgi:hypothetical protein
MIWQKRLKWECISYESIESKQILKWAEGVGLSRASSNHPSRKSHAIAEQRWSCNEGKNQE